MKPKYLIFLGALVLSLSVFCESKIEGELAIVQETEKNLEELKAEIAWFLHDRKEQIAKMSPIYRETGDLDAVMQRNQELFSELKTLDKKLDELSLSLERTIELARGPAPHTNLLQICSRNALVASYRSLIEESLFPNDWKANYSKSKDRVPDESKLSK